MQIRFCFTFKDNALIDEFTSVPIDYDPRLERIRQRTIDILDDQVPEEPVPTDAWPLTEQGRAQLQKLIDELDGMETG